MRSRYTVVGFISLSLLAALATSAAPRDLDEACLDLLDRGEHLTSIDDSDIRALGLEKLRQAERTCASPQVDPQLRARALMLGTRAHGQDRGRVVEMWSEALTLLREEAPDSRLLPEVLEHLSGIEFYRGDYEENLRLAYEALEERERLFGGHSRQYTRGLSFLAVTYEGLAEVQDRESNLLEAKRFAERAFEASRTWFGVHDPAAVGAAAILESVLHKCGLHAEAERLEEEYGPYVDLLDQAP